MGSKFNLIAVLCVQSWAFCLNCLHSRLFLLFGNLSVLFMCRR